MKPFPAVSPSSLLDFEGCPKRYHEVRILKKYPFTVTEAITYGNEVHQALENYVRFTTELPDHLEHIAPIIDGLKQLGYTLYAELECAIREDWTPTGWWEKDVWLRGKADLIGIKGDEAIVWDWKTGKKKDDPTQLEMYGAILHTVLGLRKVESAYIWLKVKDSTKVTVDDSNVAEVKEGITRRIATMKDHYERQDFPARTSPLCGWCPALDTCNEAIYYKVQRDRKRR
jgi:hypothetical protein